MANSDADETPPNSLEFDNTLNMPFPDEVQAKLDSTIKPEPDIGERTIEDPPSIEAGRKAKTLESENLDQFAPSLIELSAKNLVIDVDNENFEQLEESRDSLSLAEKEKDLSEKLDEIPTPDVSEAKVITNDIGPTDEPVGQEIVLTADEPSNTNPADSNSDNANGKTSGLKPLIAGIILYSRYEIVRKIGGGGMGAVYLARDKNLGGVERAVKEMVQSSIEEKQQKKAIEDFKRESMILSTLDHPSIPAIYDYFFDERECRFYLVMKYISGGDLASRLRAEPGGRFDEKTVCEWALQIIDVLSYLHSLPATIVYRDLKPSNIMVDDKTGRVMIIDFGIARSIDQGREQGVTAVGTMGYAPPELFSGNVEPRSDIYSLGSTMFHLLTGADPQNNPLLIFDFQKNPRPRQINQQLTDQIERILMRSVEYNADARFSSAAEMQQILSHHLENLKRGGVTYGITEIPEVVSLANQSVFCGFCGQQIVATDLFCAFCGAKQPIAQQGVHSEIYTRTATTAKLVVDGTNELQVPIFTLEKNDTLLGRRDPVSNIFPEVDLSRFDPQTKISRRHARIWRDGDNFLVEDLGSSNGTVIVPDKRLEPHKPHALINGDKIRLGDTTLHFLVG
ncbi:MAG: protein kinase domain-containing protein [Pyrinomonadaceae bacterium]